VDDPWSANRAPRCGLGPAPTAHADPTAADKDSSSDHGKHREVWEPFQSLPVIGDKTSQMCVDALVDDPDGSHQGDRQGRLQPPSWWSSGWQGFPAVQSACETLVTPLVAAATVAMNQAIADVVQCVQSTAQGDMFACNAKLVQQWIGRGAQLVWSGVVGVFAGPDAGNEQSSI